MFTLTSIEPERRQIVRQAIDAKVEVEELSGFSPFFEPLTATKLPTTAACGAATKFELSKNVSDFLRQTS